jgi:hypothetical protein
MIPTITGRPAESRCEATSAVVLVGLAELTWLVIDVAAEAIRNLRRFDGIRKLFGPVI